MSTERRKQIRRMKAQVLAVKFQGVAYRTTLGLKIPDSIGRMLGVNDKDYVDLDFDVLGKDPVSMQLTSGREVIGSRLEGYITPGEPFTVTVTPSSRIREAQ